jgi:hypothetical protein
MTSLPLKILNDIPCDLVFSLLQEFVKERTSYRIVIEPHIRGWGTADSCTQQITIQFGLAPAEGILTLVHEIGHALFPAQDWPTPRRELRCEMFSNVVTSILGFDFSERCALMTAEYAIEAIGYAGRKTGEIITETGWAILPIAHDLLSWIGRRVQQGDISFDQPTYVHRCPEWTCRAPLLYLRSVYPEGPERERAECCTGICDSTNCSKCPGYGGGPLAWDDDVPIPW